MRAVICLVGEGQEINLGEAGISEWFTALKEGTFRTKVHLSQVVAQREPAATAMLGAGNAETTSALHLAVSLRSFRAERVSGFVGYIS